MHSRERVLRKRARLSNLTSLSEESRLKENLDKLAKAIEEVDASSLGTQQVESVVIMQSELMREGPVYSPLSVIELQIAQHLRQGHRQKKGTLYGQRKSAGYGTGAN